MVLTLNRRKGNPGVIVPKIAPISGRYYGQRTLYGGTAGTTALAANVLYALPVCFPTSFTADQIALNVTVAASAGKLLRLGLYAATAAGLPGVLLADSGALAADTAAPFAAAATISQAIVAGTLYWLAVASDGAPTVTSTTTAVAQLGADTAAAGLYGGVLRVFTYGALPTPWGTHSGYSTALANILLRAV